MKKEKTLMTKILKSTPDEQLKKVGFFVFFSLKFNSLGFNLL